jgi:hypothetical protein
MKKKWVCAVTAFVSVTSMAIAFADGVRFSDYTPLTSSAGPTATEATPITFGNPDFQQQSIASRTAQLAAGMPNSGSWDMNTVNETGAQKGRYLFTVFETGQPGVQRHDLLTGVTDTIWHAATSGTHTSFDPSYWTPWGTFIVGEESWCTAPAGCTTSRFGRLFELRNPIDAPPIFTPMTPASNQNADFVHRTVVPRTSQEGIQFDVSGNMYYIDELDGGNFYKYTPAALPGALTITDPNGVSSVDGRNSTNVPAFKGTDYQRPEDMQIQTIGNNQYLYVTTTSTHEVYRLDLKSQTITVFANRNTIDLATGLAVGSALANPDNLAADHDGNIYIIEDRNGGTDNDIWFANDLNKDGDLTDPGEGIGRWASNGTSGSEFTGLYFDPTNKRRAWVNIQHPSTGNDRTIEITIGGGDEDLGGWKH